ncbi:MAG: hypothetical protein ACW98K_09120 [Candidatus Kariarchaeaceae archaeon]
MATSRSRQKTVTLDFVIGGGVFTLGLYLLLTFGILIKLLGILFMMAGLTRFSLPFIEDYLLAKRSPGIRVIDKSEYKEELIDEDPNESAP